MVPEGERSANNVIEQNNAHCGGTTAHMKKREGANEGGEIAGGSSPSPSCLLGQGGDGSATAAQEQQLVREQNKQRKEMRGERDKRRERQEEKQREREEKRT